jgi:hypothetical protein
LYKAGWKLLVERKHYEFEPSPELGQRNETRLRMEQLHDPADPRLVAVHCEVMRGTLDAADAANIKRLGFEAVCKKSLASMFIADTDNANVPMAKAFSSVGWIQTETRIDLVPGP